MRAKHQSALVILLVIVTVLGTLSVPIGAQTPSNTTEGEPELEMYLPDNDVSPASDEELNLEIQNNGTIEQGVETEQVTNAQSVVVSFDDDGAISLTDTEIPLGQIPDGETIPLTTLASIPEDIEPGEHVISGTINYSYYAEYSTDAGLASKTNGSDTFNVTLSVPDEPRFTIATEDADLEPGATGDATIEITNVGTERASNIDAVLSGDEPLTIGSGTETIGIGDLDPGENTTVTVTGSVADTAAPGEKPLRAEFTYDDTDGIESSTSPVRGTLATVERTSIAVDGIDATLTAGLDGDIDGTIENTGDLQIDGGVITVESATESIAIPDARYALSSLAPNETADFAFDASVDPDAAAGPRDLTFSLEYPDEQGTTLTSYPTQAIATVEPAASFSISDFNDTLQVGVDGDITGTLETDAPEALDDVILIAEPMSDSLFIEDTRYAVGSLSDTEAESFRFPTDVSGDADEGPRQIRFTVEYTGADGQTVTSDPISERAIVDPQTDEFAIDGVQTSIEAGETGDLVLEITNQRSGTLENIDALLYTDNPLSSDASESFVPELAPNESALIDFEISAAGDARTTTYPVELDFEYRTERGQTELSDTYQFPVEVVEPADDGGGLLPFGSMLTIGAALLTVGVGAGVFWWRRQ